MIRAMGIMSLLLLVGFAPAGFAGTEEEYRIGPGDGLAITVWGRPELTRDVTVRQSGVITYPPLGELPATGETAPSLARALEQRLNDFLRLPTQVTVEVVAFNSQRITLAGAVGTPGRFGFEKLPGLLNLLGGAGGLGSEADLSRVQIYRTESGKQTTLTVDMTQIMREGNVDELPPLRAGDIVYVPRLAGPAGQGEGQAYVVGDVARPGAYPVGNGIDLMQLISLAGGVLPSGDLSKIEVISSEPVNGSRFIATVNLQRFLDEGGGGFNVRAGDTIRIRSRSRGGGFLPLSLATRLLSTSRDILNLIVSWDVLKRR